MKLIKAISFTFFVYGLLGWLYVVLSVTFHPKTLEYPLSHLTPWIREDTSGIISFIVSLMSFLIWNFIRYHEWKK